MDGHGETGALKARLDARLAARGLTARSASLALGFNEHFVRDIASGRVEDPGARKLSRLARLLDVPLSFFFDECVDEPVPDAPPASPPIAPSAPAAPPPDPFAGVEPAALLREIADAFEAGETIVLRLNAHGVRVVRCARDDFKSVRTSYQLHGRTQAQNDARFLDFEERMRAAHAPPTSALYRNGAAS